MIACFTLEGVDVCKRHEFWSRGKLRSIDSTPAHDGSDVDPLFLHPRPPRMLKYLLPTLSRTSVFRHTPPLARWYASSDKCSSISSPPPPAPTPSSSSPSLPPSRTDHSTSRPRQFFIDLGNKRRAEKARFNEGNLILVPVSTGKEVQYSSRELFEEAQEKEKELKKERVRRAGDLFDQGRMPEEMRRLVGG